MSDIPHQPERNSSHGPWPSSARAALNGLAYPFWQALPGLPERLLVTSGLLLSSPGCSVPCDSHRFRRREIKTLIGIGLGSGIVNPSQIRLGGRELGVRGVRSNFDPFVFAVSEVKARSLASRRASSSAFSSAVSRANRPGVMVVRSAGLNLRDFG